MKEKKNVSVLLLMACVVSLLFSACMDEETWGKQAKLPYSSQSYPIAPGEEVVIKGSGFNASHRVELEYYDYTISEGGSIRKEVPIEKRTDKKLVFIAPDYLDGEYVTVYLLQKEQECCLGEIYIGGSSNIGGGSGVDNHLQVDAIITSEKEYVFHYIEDRQLDQIEIADRWDGSLGKYRFERIGETVWIEYTDEMNYDRFEVILENNLVMQIYSEQQAGLVYSVQRQGEDVFTVNYHTSGSYVEVFSYPSNESFRFWRDGITESVEVLYDEYGFENNTTVNLNALLGYQYEDNLLNVLNLAGYLMGWKVYLAVRYESTQMDDAGTLLANVGGYYTVNADGNRVVSVQFVCDSADPSYLENREFGIVYHE